MTLESEYNNMGYADSVYVPTCGELLKRILDIPAYRTQRYEVSLMI